MLKSKYPVPNEWPQPNIGEPFARLCVHLNISIASDTTPDSLISTFVESA